MITNMLAKKIPWLSSVSHATKFSVTVLKIFLKNVHAMKYLKFMD